MQLFSSTQIVECVGQGGGGKRTIIPIKCHKPMSSMKQGINFDE